MSCDVGEVTERLENEQISFASSIGSFIYYAIFKLVVKYCFQVYSTVFITFNIDCHSDYLIFCCLCNFGSQLSWSGSQRRNVHCENPLQNWRVLCRDCS